MAKSDEELRAKILDAAATLFAEYGFSGTVQVKAHMREIKQAFGRPLKEPKFVQVRAHSANVNFPERSFLRTALRDLKPDIESDLKASIERAIS